MQSSLFIITLVLQPERLIRIPIDPFVLSSDPRRYSCRTTADCRGCRSSRAVCRFGRCGNRRCIVCRLWRCQRFAPAVRSCLGRCRYRCSCLCRCTPEVIGFRPIRSGCVSVRYSSRRVCLGVVTVVFVAGYQSVGPVVFDHDVVAVGETAQFFAVASVNGGQIAAAVIVVAIWQRSSESCWLSDDLYVNC